MEYVDVNNCMRIHVDLETGNTTYRDSMTGKVHRSDGPARIMQCGSEYWYKQGLRHRADGPSDKHVMSDGTVKYDWYWEGIEHTFELWCILSMQSNEDILILKLTYQVNI
jgi:hypothetical protein